MSYSCRAFIGVLNMESLHKFTLYLFCNLNVIRIHGYFLSDTCFASLLLLGSRIFDKDRNGHQVDDEEDDEDNGQRNFRHPHEKLHREERTQLCVDVRRRRRR